MGKVTANGGRFAEFDSSWTAPQFTISLSEPAESVVTVPWRITTGTATSLVDYRGYSRVEGTATFNPGETLETVSFRLNGDTVPEPDESIVFEVFPSTNADLTGDGAKHSAVGWIQDDDGYDEPTSLWVSSPVLVEGDSGKIDAAFEVSLSRPADRDLEIPYTLGSDSARAGRDFEEASGTIIIPRGTSDSLVRFQVRGDRAAESIEYANLKLDLPNGIAETHGGKLTIVDDDMGGLPTVLVSAENFAEQDSSWTAPSFTISLTEPAASAVTVPWYISGGTATDNIDHQGYSRLSGTTTFRPGETMKSESFRLNGDTQIEFDESVVFTLTAPDGPAILPGGASEVQTVGWIEDDDGQSKPMALFVSSPHVEEPDRGRRTASFEFELSRPAENDVSIRYSTFDGSAEAGEDYVAKTGTVTINEGQSSATLGVKLKGDGKVEDDEEFSLRLFLDGEISQSYGGTATIQNDDDTSDFWKQTGNSRNNRIEGYEHRDHIRGKDGNDRLWGFDGRDRLDGGDGDDRLYGGAGSDRLKGKDGDDRLRGGDQSDRLEGGDGDDDLRGGGGKDRIDGDDGRDELRGGNGDDTLRGGEGRDKLRGGSGDDEHYGGKGKDRLDGGSGSDLLAGGKGKDVLIGGGGRDQFVFDGKGSRDKIRDYRDDFDVIVIESGANRFSQLKIKDKGDDVMIRFADTKILIQDEDHRALDGGDFIFA